MNTLWTEEEMEALRKVLSETDELNKMLAYAAANNETSLVAAGELIESLKARIAELEAQLATEREDNDASDEHRSTQMVIMRAAIEALEKISNMVTWVDEKNQKISHTYAMGTVDVATETLKQIRGENEN